MDTFLNILVIIMNLRISRKIEDFLNDSDDFIITQEQERNRGFGRSAAFDGACQSDAIWRCPFVQKNVRFAQSYRPPRQLAARYFRHGNPPRSIL
jgi:hypothetical protein